eukprot:756536-Hanusia_phi.AAC.3
MQANRNEKAQDPESFPNGRDSENGFVVKTWPDGKRYEGEMKDGKRHGKGSISYPDGAAYAGEWSQDWRHGIGEYKYTDGTWYKGCWDMGNRQGEGLCTYADGNIYEGEWMGNLPHGRGKCRETRSEDGKYRSEERDEERGDVALLEIVSGRMHGQGILTRSDGTISYEGQWKDGEKVSGGTPLSKSSPPREQTSSALELTKLFISIESAAHLPSTSSGAPNPYVVLNYGGQNHITKTLLGTFGPSWEQELAEFKVPANASSVGEGGEKRWRVGWRFPPASFPFLTCTQPIEIRVFDWNPSKSKVMGETSIDLKDTSKYQEAVPVTLNLNFDGASVSL